MSQKPGKVIVVEDEEMVRVNLTDYLMDDGFEVTSCTSAEEALQILEDERFDVAVVDIRLPRLDGASFIKEAHQMATAMKFVIHTGSPHFSLSPELNDLGIGEEHLFLKPISDMGVLSRAVRELITEARL